MSVANPAVTFVGARPRRNVRFVGDISTVVIFNSVLSAGNATSLHMDYPQLLNPQGECTAYLENGATCPTPFVSSLLCQSTTQL